MIRTNSHPCTEREWSVLEEAKREALFQEMPPLEEVDESEEQPDSDNLAASGFTPRSDPPTPSTESVDMNAAMNAEFTKRMGQQGTWMVALMAEWEDVMRNINKDNTMGGQKGLDHLPDIYKVGFEELETYVEQMMTECNVVIDRETKQTWRSGGYQGLPYIPGEFPESTSPL